MAYEIKFSDVAQLDLKEARRYYADVSKHLLRKFDAEMADNFKIIALDPQCFQKRYRDVMIVFAKTFPYGIHYLVEEDVVYIQRILHQKQFYG